MNRRLVGYAVFAYLASVPILWILLAPDRWRPFSAASSGIVEPPSAPASRGGPPSISAVAGCYKIETGRWTGGPERIARNVQPPSRVELQTRRTEGRTNGFELRNRPHAWSRLLHTAYWRPESGGAISLVWMNGFAGLHIVAHERGDRWVGTARESTDVIGVPHRSAPVVLKRSACDAALRPDQPDRYDLPRGVELASRDSIRLGEPLPSADGLFAADGNVVRVVGDAPAGFFAVATRVSATVDDYGLVDAIYVVMPAFRRHQRMAAARTPWRVSAAAP